MDKFAPVFVMGSFVAACSAKVARLPVAGESLLASHFVLEAGGKGFNLAAGASRLGLAVDGLLAIGDDLFAGLAPAALERAGLRQEMLVRYPGPTGAGIGFIEAGGENCLAVYPGANARLSAADVHQAAPRLRGARLVLAQFEIADEPIAAAFALARQTGAATLLNPSPYRQIRPDILANTRILAVNRPEAACLAGQYRLGPDHLQLAETLFSQGVETVIVTLGAGGAWLFQPGIAPHRQPAFKTDAVDTLGAGDAFIAAFAAGLIDGRSLAQSMRWAAAAGAAATTRPGVFDALPTRTELQTYLGAEDETGA
jgi:ribokinase